MSTCSLSARTCSRRRQRVSWRHHPVAAPPPPKDPELARALASDIPLRCPRSLVTAGLMRVPGLRSAEAVAALRDGEAFVSEASGLIGDLACSPLLKWDVAYLRRHLPRSMKWPVFMAGTGKIVMTHTNRHLTTAELVAMEKEGRRPIADPRFRPVSQTLLSFDDFVAATARHEKARAAGDTSSEPPYLGSDLLWRNTQEDNGNIQNIGERLKADLMGGANFGNLKDMQDAGELPLMKQV